MHSICVLLFGVVALAPASTQSHTQSFTPEAIHFTGADGYTDEDLTTAAGLALGQTYTADDLNRHAKELLDIGIFDKIAYKFDGGNLTYTVKMSSQMLPIQLGNLPLEGGAGLDEKLHARVPLYHSAVPAGGLLLEAIRQTLEELLAGIDVHAQVASEVVEDPSTHNPTAVKFSIASQPVRIGSLKLEGVSDYLRPQIEQTLKLADMPYDAEHSASTIEQTIIDSYALHGFAGAQVHAVRYGYPTVEEGVIRIPYKVTVKEGHSYRLGTVTLAHDLPIDPAEVDRLMATRSTFMPENLFLGSLVSQLETRLKGQGYLNSHVILDAQLNEASGVANYTIKADLGNVEHVNLVKSATVSGGLQNLIRH